MTPHTYHCINCGKDFTVPYPIKHEILQQYCPDNPACWQKMLDIYSPEVME